MPGAMHCLAFWPMLLTVNVSHMPEDLVTDTEAAPLVWEVEDEFPDVCPEVPVDGVAAADQEFSCQFGTEVAALYVQVHDSSPLEGQVPTGFRSVSETFCHTLRAIGGATGQEICSPRAGPEPAQWYCVAPSHPQRFQVTGVEVEAFMVHLNARREHL